MIGRLEKTVIDCPEPRALANFYCQILGMSVNEGSGDWVVIGSEPACGSWYRSPYPCRVLTSVGRVDGAHN